MSMAMLVGLCGPFILGVITQAASPVRMLLLENQLDQALPYCRQFEVLSTLDNDNLLACAWVYFRTDRMESGDKILEKLKQNYSTPEYQMLVAFSKTKKKKFEEARQIFASLEKEHKGTPISLSAQELYAEAYEMQGELGTAAFHYKRIVGEDSKRARSHWGLARHYLSRGESGRASHHFEQTAKLWPRHIGSRFNLGVIALTANNLPEAAIWLGECYKLDKADPGVLENLGLLFERKGMYSDAVKYWERALALKKDSSIAKEKLGALYSKLIDQAIEKREYHKALTYIEAHGSLILDQSRIRLQRGVIQRNLGQFEKASGELLAYLSLTPNDPQAMRELGICYLNMKLFSQAATYFAKAVTQDPEDGLNHAWLAFVLENKGELARARDEWKRATELLRDPEELAKAARKLANIEKKLQKDKR